VDQVLVPTVESNCSLPSCAKKLALLFYDDCAVHRFKEVLIKLVRPGILVITYPPHIAHIFQVLDILYFRVLARAKNYQRKDDPLAANVDHIPRLFRSYDIATQA
jgi:hypothetical protein